MRRVPPAGKARDCVCYVCRGCRQAGPRVAPGRPLCQPSIPRLQSTPCRRTLRAPGQRHAWLAWQLLLWRYLRPEILHHAEQHLCTHHQHNPGSTRGQRLSRAPSVHRSVHAWGAVLWLRRMSEQPVLPGTQEYVSAKALTACTARPPLQLMVAVCLYSRPLTCAVSARGPGHSVTHSNPTLNTLPPYPPTLPPAHSSCLRMAVARSAAPT